MWGLFPRSPSTITLYLQEIGQGRREHTHTDTRVHPATHKHPTTHAHPHPHPATHAHPRSNAHTHTHTHTHTRTHTPVPRRAHTDTHTHTHTQLRTHTPVPTRTHTDTHAHPATHAHPRNTHGLHISGTNFICREHKQKRITESFQQFPRSERDRERDEAGELPNKLAARAAARSKVSTEAPAARRTLAQTACPGEHRAPAPGRLGEAATREKAAEAEKLLRFSSHFNFSVVQECQERFGFAR